MVKSDVSKWFPIGATYFYSYLLNYDYQSRMVKMMVVFKILKICCLGALFFAIAREVL